MKTQNIKFEFAMPENEIIKALKVADEKTKLYMSSQVKKYCSPFVPFRQGALDNTSVAEKDGVLYNTPYASRMYYGVGIKFNKKPHEKATKEWDKAMMAEKGEDLLRSVGSYIKSRQ